MTHVLRADNEWRYDLLDEAFTVVARNRRTLEPLSVRPPPSEEALRALAACPFCEGDVPQPLDRVTGPSGLEVIALPSPTPLAFVEDEPPPARPFAAQGALGAHELLVVNDRALHGTAVAALPEEALALLLWAFCRRRADLAGDKRLGGATLCIAPAELARFGHAHAALLAAPFVAPRYSSPEVCPGCRELTDARARGRVVIEADAVTAYVPFAPRSNVHVRIAAAVHGTSLLGPKDGEEHSSDVARVLKAVLSKVARVAPGAQLLLRVCPLPLEDASDGRTGHLLLEVESLFEVDAALAAGLGVRVVSVPPEELAERLRVA